MRYSTILICALLAGCATQQTVTLLPRGPDRTQGTGSLDRLKNILTVELKGKRYQGPAILQTASSTSGPVGLVTTTTYTNQSSALLRGDDGHMRCDFGWDKLMIRATGVCVDNNNTVYDLLIEN